MNAASEALRECLRRSAMSSHRLVSLSEGEIESIASDQMSCSVIRHEKPTLYHARLQSLAASSESYVKILPKAGSHVIVGVIDNDPSEAYVLAAHEIESFSVKQGKTEFEIKEEKLIVKQGKMEFEIKEGKVKIKNNGADLKEILSDLMDTIKGAKITTPYGPATGSVDPSSHPGFDALKNKVEQLFL